MLGLNVHAPDCLSDGFPVKAVVLPRVSGAVDTTIGAPPRSTCCTRSRRPPCST